MTTDERYEDEVSEREQSTAITVIRWIAVIPAAMLGCLAGRFLIVFFVGLWHAPGVDTSHTWWVWFERVISQYVSGAALGGIFVGLAAWIAPSHRRAVAVVSTGAVLVIAGFVLFPTILKGDYWVIFEIVSMGFGACGIAYTVCTNESPFG